MQRKFDKVQNFVWAHLIILASFAPLKKHSSENVISFSSVISRLVVVFQSLSIQDDLKSVTLFNQAVGKLKPILKEAWPLGIMAASSLKEFNKCIKDEVEGHHRF